MSRHTLSLLFLIALVAAGSACGIGASSPGGDSLAVETAVAATLAAQAQEASVAEAVAATLTAEANDSQAEGLPDTPTPTATQAAIDSPQPPTDTPPSPTVEAQAQCTVVSSGLNLRPGPGTNFDPAITSLSNGTELIPQGRDSTGAWIEVRVANTNQVGWVSSGVQFVSCSVDVPGLPLAQIPPTPTPPATSTPPPTQPPPTPTPPVLVVDPIEGGGNWLAQIVHPDYFPAATSELMLQVRAYDGDVGTKDGDGIKHVDFFIFNQQDQLVYEKREVNPRFCAFGGGDDDSPCPAWVFADHGYRWPNGNPIENGLHRLEVEVLGDDGRTRDGEYAFQIQSPYQPQSLGADLVLRIVQTGPGTTSSTVSDALVFRAEAYNPAVGNQDGAGIDNVDMVILDSGGREVYHRTENVAGYCAFQGGEPDCDVWVFDEHGNRWPGDIPIENDIYTLRATANSYDGRHKTVETTIQIQLGP